MEEEPRTLEDLVEKELKEPAIEKLAPNLWKDTFNLYPDEIYVYINHKNHHVRSFAMACLVIKLRSQDIIRRNQLDYIIEAGKFAELNPNDNYLIPFYTDYDNLVGIAIRSMTRLSKDSRRMAEVAVKIKASKKPKDPPDRKDLSMTDAFGSMQMMLCAFLWEKVTKLDENMSERMIDVLLDQIEFYSKLGFDLKAISVASIFPILEFIQYRNHIFPNKKGFPQNVKKDREYIAKLRKFDEKDDDKKYPGDNYKEEFDDIIYRLDNPEPEDERFYEPPKLRPVKVKVQKIPNYMQVIPKKLDFSKLNLVQIPDSMRDYADYEEQIYPGKYDNTTDVYCKVYNLKSYDQNMLDQIYKEVKCYQALSDIGNDETCFLNFYGVIYNETQIVMIFEKLNETLNQRILNTKNSQVKFQYDQIVNWTSDLIHSLAQMEKLGMYHGNISTLNIWINDRNKLKLINFMNTSVGNEEHSSLTSALNIVGPVTTFSAPELQGKLLGSEYKFKKSKADVYSLGMVLLSLITLENLDQYLNKIKELKIEIDELNNRIQPKEIQAKFMDEGNDHAERKRIRNEEKKKREEEKRKELEEIMKQKEDKNPIYMKIKNIQLEDDYKKMLRAMLDINPKQRPRFNALTNMIAPIKTRTCTTAKVKN